MKKFAMTAVAAAAVLGAGAAHAYTSGTFSNGFVVPNVVMASNGGTTTVGLINNATTTTSVFWTFFDQESNHVTDGCFTMTANDYEPFVWSAKAGTGLTDKRGYLVFAAANTANTTCSIASASATLAASANIISGNAFYVDPVSKDVAFTPVIDGPLTLSPTTADLTTLGPTSLTAVAGAATIPATGGEATPTFAIRYFVDGATGGNDTNVVVWSTGDQRGTYTVNMYDNNQERKSVNFQLDNAELDWFNPETIVGRPASFVDGWIRWQPSTVPSNAPTGTGTAANVPLVTVGGSLYTYSVISAPAFGAVQTVLGSHTK